MREDSNSSTTKGSSGVIPNIKRLRRQLRRQNEMTEMHNKFYTLMLTLDDIRAGPIYLRDLINASRPSNFSEFINFL